MSNLTPIDDKSNSQPVKITDSDEQRCAQVTTENKLSTDSKLSDIGEVVGQENSNNSLPVVLSNEQEVLSDTRHQELICELRNLQNKILEVNLGVSDIKIKSADGNSEFAKVTNFQSLKVNNQNIPDKDDPITQVPVTGFLLENGSGTSDARVNASLASPVDFSIISRTDGDIYLQSLAFTIVDANAALNDFGAINITNGMQLIYSNNDLGENILADNLTTNFDFVRLCQGQPAFSETQAFRAVNVVGNSEGYIPVLNLKQVFGLPFGIRIRKNSEDRLILRVRDDITSIDAFDIFYFGNRLV